MRWPSFNSNPLSTTPLILSNEYSIEHNDVEFRNGKFILQEDESMSMICTSSELRVREIRPNDGFEYTLDEGGSIVFNGSTLNGDQYGYLQIGIFHTSLDYPLKVIKFELTAPFSVKGEVVLRGEELTIKRFRRSNEPPAESTNYPYRFEYNTSTADSENNWNPLPLVFAQPCDFRTTPTIDPVPDQISAAYRRGHPVRIRLCSSRGDTYGFEAICKRKEIIRFLETRPPVPLMEWIQYPKVLNIFHEKYRFDESSMEESWVEFSRLGLESAGEWLQFQPLEFTATATMKLLDEGRFIEIKLVFDHSESQDLVESPTDFLLSLEPSLGQKSFRFQDLMDFSVNSESSKIGFSIRQPLPKERVEFNPRTTRMSSLYEVYNEGQKFYSNSPFSKTDWNLLFVLSHKQTPSSPSQSKTLCRWIDPLVIKKENKYLSRVHPQLAKLFKCEFKRIEPNMGMFCIECGSMGVPQPDGIFKCQDYKCGWTNAYPVLTGHSKVEVTWFDYEGKAQDGLHHFSLNTDRLSSGEYVASFNGVSFHFDVS
jgi:hypothetical protein